MFTFQKTVVLFTTVPQKLIAILFGIIANNNQKVFYKAILCKLYKQN